MPKKPYDGSARPNPPPTPPRRFDYVSTINMAFATWGSEYGGYTVVNAPRATPQLYRCAYCATWDEDLRCRSCGAPKSPY